MSCGHPEHPIFLQWRDRGREPDVLAVDHEGVLHGHRSASGQGLGNGIHEDLGLLRPEYVRDPLPQKLLRRVVQAARVRRGDLEIAPVPSEDQDDVCHRGKQGAQRILRGLQGLLGLLALGDIREHGE